VAVVAVAAVLVEIAILAPVVVIPTVAKAESVVAEFIQSLII
jgi:hypothetical protein